MKNFCVVITSISSPNLVMKAIAEGANVNGNKFYVIGDEKSPDNFIIDHCEYYSIKSQNELEFKTSALALKSHYSRKNIGYLIAMRDRHEIIVETDDDNVPIFNFWGERKRKSNARPVMSKGWINLYKYYSNELIWPRGYPIEKIMEESNDQYGEMMEIDCPIQQGLADGDPDVDAIYRMTAKLPIDFLRKEPISIGNGVMCPFNSQNTTWFKPAFALMYLPTYCSFRMTDIWRSFVAQRIAWACEWNVLFHNSTVRQDRNEHDLLRDFEEEIPGYLNNQKIMKILIELPLKHGESNLFFNLKLCYQALLDGGFIVDENELILLDAWENDVSQLLKL